MKKPSILIRWNQHILAPSKGNELPRGRPDSLYFIPELMGVESCEKPLDEIELACFETTDLVEQIEDCDPNFVEFAEIVLVSLGLQPIQPKTLVEATEVYFILLEAIEDAM